MRESGSPAKLGELLGAESSDKKQLSMEDLPELLGEKMPDLPLNRVGHYRLMQSLKQRFGAGYRNIPMIQGIISEFEQKMKDENVIKMNMRGRNGNK